MNTFLNSSDYWLSVAEVALRSHCSRQAVRVRILSGKLIAMKRYGQWLVNTQSLQHYLRDKGLPKDATLRLSSGWKY
jgi:Helix-turn-helix domain